MRHCFWMFYFIFFLWLRFFFHRSVRHLLFFLDSLFSDARKVCSTWFDASNDRHTKTENNRQKMAEFIYFLLVLLFFFITLPPFPVWFSMLSRREIRPCKNPSDTFQIATVVRLWSRCNYNISLHIIFHAQGII